MRKLSIILLVSICQLFTISAKAQTSDSCFARQLRQYGIGFDSHHSVRIITSGREKFELLFDDIRRAKSSIHLEYFNFRNDSIAGLLFDLLRQKRKEGVEVRALFDGFGNDSNNKPLRKEHLKQLRDDGISIYEFDPIRFPWINHIWPRDHRKIVVIDGEIGYTGGMNVADYYVVGSEQVGEWRDMHCRIEGPAVNELQRIFARIWKRVAGEQLSAPKYYHAKPAGQMMVGIANREPRKSNEIMRRFYVTALDQAKDSVKIINPYFLPTQQVMRAIKRCAKRGVKVDMLISSRYDEPITPDIVLHNTRKLSKLGVRVWRYRPGFHHSKIFMADGRYCTIGSTNLDARGLRYDYEINAIIVDTAITRQLERKFLEDLTKSDYMSEEEWQKMSGWERFKGWLARLLFGSLI